MRSRWAPALAVVLACGHPARHAATPPPLPDTPPLVLSLPALDGGTLDFATLRGQVVVIHVFTTWSLDAAGEVDALRAADARPDVAVVGLALDTEGRVLVAPWRHASEVRYLVVLADDAVRAGKTALGPLPSVPITIVLDRAGRIHARVDHALGPDELDALIEAALDVLVAPAKPAPPP